MHAAARCAWPVHPLGEDSRRRVCTGIASSAALVLLKAEGAPAQRNEQELGLELERIEDKRSGFALELPRTYRRKNKPGSSALWASPLSKYDQVGVSLEPVKINTLSEFGSIDDVSDRLLKSEKQKSSTLDVTIDKQASTFSVSGAEMYILLYQLKNIYGKKEVATTASVSNGRLYLLNAQSYLSGDSSADSRKAELLERIARSFDIIK